MKELIIKIKALLEAAGFNQATDAIKKMDSAVSEVGTKAEKTSSKLAECVAKGAALGGALSSVAVNAASALLHGLERSVDAIKELVSEGLKFNRLMQDSQIALAGGFRSVNPSLSFPEAKQMGGEALDALKSKAMELGINFEALVETFKVNVPTMWEAGIRDTQKMINLITLLNQVAAAKGISGFQAQRDIIDLLNGMGQRTILGKELEANGVSNESIKSAKEQGTLYELLSSKLSAYGEAGKAASETQTAALERLHTAWTSLLGSATKPFFDETTEGLGKITTFLGSLVGSAHEAGVAVRGIIAAYKDLASSPELEALKKVRDLMQSPQRMLWDNTVGRLVRADEDRGREEGLNERWERRAKQLHEAQQKLSEQQKNDQQQRLDSDYNWSVPLKQEQAAQRAREKDLSETEQSAERDRKISALPAVVRAGALQRQLADTRSWTNDRSRSEEDRLAGKKKVLELDKQLAAVEKEISDEALKAQKTEKTNAAKREEYALELSIAEAKSNGDDKLLKRLEWQRQYNRLLKENQDVKDPDAFNHAIRGANAAMKEDKSKALPGLQLSSLAKSGNAMGETASAATDMLLRQILAKQANAGHVADIASAVKEIAKSGGGYR